VTKEHTQHFQPNINLQIGTKHKEKMFIDFLANMNMKAIDMNTMRPKHTKKMNKKAKQYDITKN
jgi:hypothetical protein